MPRTPVMRIVDGRMCYGRHTGCCRQSMFDTDDFRILKVVVFLTPIYRFHTQHSECDVFAYEQVI